MIWQNIHYSELTLEQLYQILKLRNKVFIVEQCCAYQDIDDKDLTADTRHLMLWQDRQLMAYARLLTPKDNHSPAIIGRVIVAPEARGQNIGYQLLEKAVNGCKACWPQHAIKLSAQAHLQKFYGSQGFTPQGDVYDEDGIPHIEMYLNGLEG